MFEVGDVIDGHTICLKALVGSHNYNLNTANSDRDYKYFVWPTFDDLYENKMYHKEVVTETEDYTVHDIRKLPMLLWKANLNFIEILYSQELDGDKELVSYLTVNRLLLATMNLHGLYNAAVGMSFEKEKLMTKDSPARHEAMERYGYDAKSACHAYRVLDFLSKYHATKNIQQAFWYDSSSSSNRWFLLDIKAGKFSLEDVRQKIHDIRAHVEENCKEEFYSYESDEETYDALSNWLKNKIRQRIVEEK